MVSIRHATIALVAGAAALLTACTAVGPDFEKPIVELPPDWSAESKAGGLETGPQQQVEWWRVFDDPVLDLLVERARLHNNTLEIAALRILEAQAQLGIVTGQKYPQVQAAAGQATYVSPPGSGAAASNFWQLGLGATASWEIDFWGRYRRGIESADAAYLASVAAYDQALIILTAAVVDLYLVVRATEEQLRIARENVAIQQRSYEITEVLYRNGADSELDMQQAQTLLLSTKATIPGLETALAQAQNALSVLLGQAPGALRDELARGSGIPGIPDRVAVGVPADMLRQRPDVRQAEYTAMAQNALIGLAEADLYPSFSLSGSIGLTSTTAGDSDFGDLFSSDAFSWSVGPSFIWPFLNYGRIKNNVRVQDARLQQALVAYRETVLQAAREAEDAMASLIGSRQQHAILEQSVKSALRSNELSVLRYSEGYSDYERVLNAQQALFREQQRYIVNRGDMVRNLVALYKALGGGWENRADLPGLDPETVEQMRERTDWGELLDTPQ
ncbi:MAG: efflux transporter outer membrane subunit [Xanthomonadales bacterium]|jgi:NodT family efflux transporter outer membrane factor (OMF) lipoprotein|nr:efflux transporter outer membrane subunit [Xanthomonadales bacterium]